MKSHPNANDFKYELPLRHRTARNDRLRETNQIYDYTVVHKFWNID